MSKINVLALDVGGRRIGMAVGDTEMKIPRILPTMEVSDGVFEQITDIITYEGVDTIVVGYPRNLSGETTEQTRITEQFADELKQHIDIAVEFQDESLTSIRAEELLRQRGKPYVKADIDAEAAAIILHDFLERQ
jgi:putative Holliday junction resolvase